MESGCRPCYPASPWSGFEYIRKLPWFQMSKLQWKNRYSFHNQRDPSFSKQTALPATSAAFFPFSKLINENILTNMWYMGEPKVCFNPEESSPLPLQLQLSSPT